MSLESSQSWSAAVSGGGWREEGGGTADNTGTTDTVGDRQSHWSPVWEGETPDFFFLFLECVLWGLETEVLLAGDTPSLSPNTLTTTTEPPPAIHTNYTQSE